MIITKPGFYEMTEAEYHSDPVMPFSLSRSIAHMMITECPKKAKHAHPKLGKGGNVEPNEAMDDGSILHGLLLGKGAAYQIVTATYDAKHKKAGQAVTNYATKAAQAERDAIRESGGIPLLVSEEAAILACAKEATAQMKQHSNCRGFFAEGKSEIVAVWEEDGLFFRILVDRLPDDPRYPPYDLKFTKLSAAPGSWDKRLENIYAFQDAFYRRGLTKLRGEKCQPMQFPVIELDDPYCLAVHAAAPTLQYVADVEVDRAIRRWRECVATGNWPGYPNQTAWVEASTWRLNKASQDEMNDTIWEGTR